ncbi:MAG: 4-hydroxy-tetrahydrodipicolinate reductase [Opitutales bacterium]
MKPIKVGLVGYGRAGQTAAREIINDPELSLAWVARRHWHKKEVSRVNGARVLRLDGTTVPVVTSESLADPHKHSRHRADLVVDLAGSDAIRSYAHLARRGVRIVSAVSHYDAPDLAVLRGASHHSAVLHSPNITLGINLILVVAKMLKKLIPHADIQILEEHFSAKEGRSGTAERLAKMLDMEPDNCIRSIRAGGIIGKHELIFGLSNQTIRLVHESISRKAFARGALLAGKWLMSAPASFYSMEELVFRKMRAGFLAEAEEEAA